MNSQVVLTGDISMNHSTCDDDLDKSDSKNKMEAANNTSAENVKKLFYL